MGTQLSHTLSKAWVLGLPLGHPEYIQEELAKLSRKLPALPDLQASWLLLLYCAAPRVYYALRGLRPNLTRTFAATPAHAWYSYSDYQRMTCRQHPATTSRIAQLALKQGGLGLWGTQNHTAAAYWASWQDAAPILRSKAPQVFGLLSQQLCTGNPGLPTIQCLQHVTAFLSNLGFQAPPCTQCAEPP